MIILSSLPDNNNTIPYIHKSSKISWAIVKLLLTVRTWYTVVSTCTINTVTIILTGQGETVTDFVFTVDPRPLQRTATKNGNMFVLHA